MPLANGEPSLLLDTVEAAAARGDLEGVTVHQMHALSDRPYLHGAYGDRLRHVSYFLSHVTRPCYLAGTLDLVVTEKALEASGKDNITAVVVEIG